MGSILRVVIAAHFVVSFFMPHAVQAETYIVESVDYRDYKSLFFEPQFIRIEPGDSITFSVTNFDHQPQSVFIPDGARPWKSESGENITVQFSKVGVYLFDCVYHNVMGMAGVILVGRAGTPDNYEEEMQLYSVYRDETFVMNKDRLDYIWNRDGPLFGDSSFQ